MAAALNCQICHQHGQYKISHPCSNAKLSCSSHQRLIQHRDFLNFLTLSSKESIPVRDGPFLGFAYDKTISSVLLLLGEHPSAKMHVCVCFYSFAVAAYKEGYVHWREEHRAVVGSNGSACLLYLCCTLALSQSHCKVGLQLLNSVCQRSLRSPTEPGWAAGGGD